MSKKYLFKPNISCDFNHNIIKTRDDTRPICFIAKDDEKFDLCEHHESCSWAKHGTTFSKNILRARVEPWLTSLFQSEHLTLLAGSGLTTGICSITNTRATGMQTSEFIQFKGEIHKEAERVAKLLRRGEGNFEDYIRAANDLLHGLKMINHGNARALHDEIQNKISDFSKSLLKTEADLVNAAQPKRTSAFNCLISFLMSFSSRTGSRDRVNIFTTT